MNIQKYIKPMSFFELNLTMFRLYFKFFIPILLLNILIVAMSWWALLAGAFVGPILLMTSNAILGKKLKVFDSFRKGIFSIAFLKIAASSIMYLLAILALDEIFFYLGDTEGYSVAYSYILLIPFWIFTPMIILLEKKGLRASIKRAFYILRHNFGRILQMDILTLVVFSLLAWVLIGIFGDVFAGLAVAFFIPLLTGFSTLPYVFVYYEFRARHENYSEEILAQEMGYQPMQEMMI